MKRNNDHITMLSNGKPLEPKYLKSYYDMSDAGTHYDFNSYKDVPGWVNDAEYVYEKAVSQAEDGAHFVEIGVLYGQSATRMADLIKKSEKDIKFDAIDIFWGIEHGTKNYLTQNQPYQFLQYLEQPRFENWTIMQIVQFPIIHFGLSDYVNFITCDERYAHRLYDDNSLDFVWIDGDHNEGVVYNDLVNFWPKLKSGAMIAGDDMKSPGVYRDVQTFIDDNDLRDYYNPTPLNIGKDGINQSNGFRIIKK